MTVTEVASSGIVLLRTMRFPFLVLTPVCVLLGAAAASAGGTVIDLPLLALILAGALGAHLAVNMLNEHHDFCSGLDLNTTRTPFSGGSGALPAHPAVARQVFGGGVTALVVVALLGLYFLWRSGPGIVPLGLAGIVLIVSYSGWINRHPFWCLIAPGFGFGVLMVIGTAFVLSGNYSLLSACAAGLPFLLVNNLLLLNQYPDIAADRQAGRRHVPIAYGTRVASAVYGLSVAAAVVLLTGAVIAGIFPVLCLLALLPLPLALYALAGALHYGPRLGEAPKFLAANVAVAVGSPLLLAVGLLVGEPV